MPHAYRIGVIRVIGAGTRFVLIEVSLAGAVQLPVGQMLHCFNPASADVAPAATVSVAHERRPPFIVADVVAGEPRVGDIACLAPTPVASPNPSMILPTSTSGVLPIVLPNATPGTKNP